MHRLRFALIMAGGRGTRFWPVSRAHYPKQLLKIISRKSLIRETAERILPLVGPGNTFVVTVRDHAGAVRRDGEQLRRAGRGTNQADPRDAIPAGDREHQPCRRRVPHGARLDLGHRLGAVQGAHHQAHPAPAGAAHRHGMDDLRPQLVVCSSAVRARETLTRMLPSLGEPDVWIEVTLYAASAETLLARVRSLPDEVDDAMLVGHNPGLMDLVMLLAGPGPQRDRASVNVPTGALVVLETGVTHWSSVSAGTASLTTFVVPRDLR